ncbi:MAG: YceH family protein [Burkholderiales bacterium]|nr:YceH family protein [Burkholderiales bacterium]
MPLRPLSPLEARVLGTLMEKARTVPDSYPLTLNSLVSGCNQKSSREPLMNITETQAQEALDDLKALHLVFETSGGRVTRYEHNLQRALAIPDQSAALLGLLMLRGPQTAGELRINAERWHRFADISSVEAFLDELQERGEAKGGPLVVRMARAPGAREQRWAHLLCGPVDEPALAPSAVDASGNDTSGTDASQARALHVRMAALESEVAGLRATVQKLCGELGLSQPGQDG